MENDKTYVVIETLKSISKTAKKDVGHMMNVKFSKRVNPSAIAVLVQLMNGETKTLKELSHDVGLANSTTSGIVDKLVEEGYVIRVQDEDDRRRVMISATDKALKYSQEFEEKYKKYVHELLKSADPNDYKIIIAGFSKFHELLKTKVNN